MNASTLKDFLRSKGFACAIGLPLPGKGNYTRFSRTNGDDLNGFFNGYTLPGGIIVASCGDWSTKEYYQWRSPTTEDGTPLTPEQNAELDAAAQAGAEEERVAREASWTAVAQKLQLKFDNAVDRGSSPYLERKGLPLNTLYGCRLDLDSPHGIQTLVPSRDTEGKFWGFQRISGKPNAKGKFGKYYVKGMRGGGGFHLLEPESAYTLDRIFFCEGIATAASIYEDYGKKLPVVSCFHCGNVPPVVAAWRAKYSQAELIVCVDLDKGKAGLQAGQKAVQMSRARLVCPEFTLSEQGTDYNDFSKNRGPGAIRAHIEAQLEKGLGSGAGAQPEAGDQGPHFEKRVTDAMLNEFNGRIIQQRGTLFVYDETHWLELDDVGVNTLKNKLSAAMGDRLESKKVNSMFNTFLRYVPGPANGVNLFSPSPDHANFLDGTLHLRRDLVTGIFTTEFLPHNPLDYLTWVLPVNYQGDRSIRNPLLDKLLLEAFGEGEAAKESIASIQECGGAMLISAFPQIFIFHGISGSRKSTVAKTMLKIFEQEGFNLVSFVDPSQMENFQVEGMLGKLVNAKTDIDDMKALPRGFLKSFEDDLPYQVNRKGKKVVNARLPALHLFCANTLPPNHEKSKAMGRRVTIVGFDRDLVDGPGAEVRKAKYENLVYAASKEGVLNFMLEGLDRLIRQGGIFSQPAASLAKVRDWTESYDPVAIFVKACVEGEISPTKTSQYAVHKEAKVLGSSLWEIFQQWHSAEYGQPSRMGRRRVFDALRSKGFEYSRESSGRYFYGIGLVEIGSGIC